MISLLSLFFVSGFAFANPDQEIFIKKGTYVPFFRDLNELDQNLPPLYVDKYPITNQEYLEFVKKNPKWKKSKIKVLFAGDGYLAHWKNDSSIPASAREQPVTNVSWFAARAYCESQGKRLLKTSEWEYISDSQNKENLQLILDWYGQTGSKLKKIQESKKNALGVYGMHGLIWEWVEDFSSSIMSNDSRNSNESSKSLYCGSGSLKAKDPSQYSTFMRFAYRSSLKANSVGRILGFRCVRDVQSTKENSL